MKKFIASFFSLVLGVQGFASSVGVHGSLSLNNSSEILSAKSVNLQQGESLGFMAGVSLESSLNSHFSLVNEVNYAQKGFSATQRFSRNDYDVRSFTGNYLSVPLLAKLKITPDSVIRPYLYVGPEVAFKLSGKAQLDSRVRQGSNVSVTANSQDVGSDLRGVIFSGVAGIGTEVLISDSAAFFLDGRFTLGLTNALDDRNSVNGDSMKLSSIQGIGGFKFAL